MKKITLLITFLAISMYIFPQQTISFEAGEGFALGDINAQSGWVTTGCGAGCNVVNQNISDEQATNGTFSLKTSVDPAFGGQTGGPIIGGFYDLAAPVDYTTAVVSYDIFINQQDANSSDFRFGVTGLDAMGDSFFVFFIDFNFQGNVRVVNAAGDAFIDAATWNVNTWYNVRAEITGSNITYFLDDVQIAQSVNLSDLDFTGIRFVHDNFAGDGFIDNVRINDEELSIDQFSQNSFTHNYSKISKKLYVESSNIAMSNIEIYSLLGQNVISKTLTNNSASIDVAELNDGVYIAKVFANGNVKSIKFVKN
ncbi:T9SS type A sorting domain-containing protein [Winogradskyella sp. PE311]|uniref:T9SS type A sorting domain-containing protein n=1 Tax=Winogradskyella sp. PE311 TaxID=3366943 RepID=UPI00397FBC54